jgi:dGTPase
LISSAVVSLRNERNHEKKPKQQGDHRTPAQRDRDRVLYSSAFRRLAEVTQVVAANSGYIFHNRLTHSLQVAQVGRRLSEKLVQLQNELGMFPPDGIDPDVVEAACLAHDLGHPPFGHVIEEQLNELGKDVGGFEGNAQSFRIVTKLAFHSPKYSGLDLTRATLAALLKYPWARGENEKSRTSGDIFNLKKTISNLHEICTNQNIYKQLKHSSWIGRTILPTPFTIWRIFIAPVGFPSIS